MTAVAGSGPEVIGQRLPSGEMVLREVGRGASARVYLVSDGASVGALKLLPPGQEPRADHEHRIASGFVHPNVVRVDARVDVAGWPGVRMPLVSGRRLLARGGGEGVDRADYLDAFAQLLGALAYLHAGGVVHRDVKPENVLIDRAGHVTLIDFDLAYRMAEPSAAPRVAGTLAYLSPEQARGEPATPASDLYAAGVMLYAALTGEVPYGGAIEALVAGRRPAPGQAGGVARPSAIDPALAPADALVAGLLAPDPAVRFADAAGAAAALGRVRDEWRKCDRGSM
jgi:eukaryotic-like serine/threonine-protein kinase